MEAYAHLREEGKSHFKAKEFDKAILSYSSALNKLLHSSSYSCSSEDHSFSSSCEAMAGCLTNRAICFAKLEKWEDSCRDSATAVSILLSHQEMEISGKSTTIKALFRLGKSLYEMAKVEKTDALYLNSSSALKYLLIVDPDNDEAQKLLRLVSQEDVIDENNSSISRSRQVVNYSFHDASSTKASPHVHPAVQRALLLKILYLYQIPDYKNAFSDLTADSSASSRLFVDTNNINEGEEDGPRTPSSHPSYNQFAPLSTAVKAPAVCDKDEQACSKVGDDEISEETSIKEAQYCNVCRDIGDLRCSRCKLVHYCSSRCQTCDWAYHKHVCRRNSSPAVAESESSQTPPTRPGKSGSNLLAGIKNLSRKGFGQRNTLSKFGNRKTCRGAAGLENLGNSCYLNSPLQCLSHIFPLVKYFITDEYTKHINTTSPDSTKGVLAKEFSSLLKQLWLRPFPAPVLQPTAFRRVLGALNADYSTFQQQDAHDLLSFVLDKLHEDVNLIAKKPYVELSEVKTIDDEERVGRENWDKHLMRHDSAVQDVVGGVVKSQILCPLLEECGKVSITFDYASTVQLAIPQRKRDRSNSTGVHRNRARTLSGQSQYMELLVNNSRGRSSSVDTVMLTICFIPQVEPCGAKISALGPHEGTLALSTLNSANERIAIEVMIEDLKRSQIFSVKQKLTNSLLRCVKNLYKSIDSSPFCRREKGEIILVELEDAPSTVSTEGGGGSAPSSGYIANRLLDEKDTVASIISGHGKAPLLNGDDDDDNDDNVALIAAYWLSSEQIAETPNISFIMQKKVTLSIGQGREEEVGSIIVGKPLLLTYDASWNCNKFRYAIWMQVRRFLVSNATSSLSNEEKDAASETLMNVLLNEDEKSQVLLSQCLRIKLVDRLGSPQPGFMPPDTRDLLNKEAGVASSRDKIRNLNLDCATPSPMIDVKSDDFLSYLPVSADISIGDFVGDTESSYSPFFCVEYVHGWLDHINDQAFSTVQPLSGEGVILPPVSSDSKFPENSEEDPFAGIETDEMDIKRDHVGPPESNKTSNVTALTSPGLNRKIPDGTITLEECLELYTTEEKLDDENSWYCNRCKTHRQAFKTLQFYKLPPVLIIGLKRFESHTIGASAFGGGIAHREKISSFVDFPLNGLDMSPYSKPLPPPACLNSDGVDERYLYDLVAVCNHYGRMGFGHYTAFARDWDGSDASLRNDTWCCYDDEAIHHVDAKSVKTSAAYILFYRRRKF